MTAVSFSTVAQPNPHALVLIEVPERIVKKLGAGKRVPVRVNLNGVAYRSTIAVYGGRYYLPARKEICEAARLVPGGRARVSLEVDTAPRTVEVPPDLAHALRAAKVRAGFDAFSFSHRKEFADWVTSAKRPETRAARIPKVVAQVRAKATAPSPMERSSYTSPALFMSGPSCSAAFARTSLASILVGSPSRTRNSPSTST